MSDPLNKVWNQGSLTTDVAEALRRWERRAGNYARVQRFGMEAWRKAFEGVDNLQVASHAESSRDEQKEKIHLRNEEIVVWVGQTIKEIEIFQKQYAAATSAEKCEVEKFLLVDYNAKPSDNAREIAFREASLLWSVAEKTVQNIFDSPDFREERDRAPPFSFSCPQSHIG